MLNEVMYKFAELLENLPKEQVIEKEIELLPNTFAELSIDQPIKYSENIYVAAADEDIELLHEKKRAMPPEDMIEKAHPKPVYVANAKGQGGLVENQNERQAKIIQMINKRPTGQHWNTYAGLIEDLVKVASSLEEKGQLKLAAEVDQILKTISE